MGWDQSFSPPPRQSLHSLHRNRTYTVLQNRKDGPWKRDISTAYLEELARGTLPDPNGWWTPALWRGNFFVLSSAFLLEPLPPRFEGDGPGFRPRLHDRLRRNGIQ